MVSTTAERVFGTDGVRGLANGLLTRDACVIERKKAGLKKARKAPQYSKR